MMINNQIIKLYQTMRTIRVFEESLCSYIEDATIKTPVHLTIGQEAIATGICANLSNQDLIWGNHRSHGHYIAKGGNSQKLMDEIFCKKTGCSGGRGGSMHIIDKNKGILGTVPIVAGTVPLAVGAALAFKLDKKSHISVAFFGDGATEEGHVIEAINIAALYQLPILFVIENNLYSSHMHMNERRNQHDLLKIAEMHSIEAEKIDGNDVELIYQKSNKLIEKIRSGEGPKILECMTFRIHGHVGHRKDEDVGVSRKVELQEWIKKDPLSKLYQEYKDLQNDFDRIDTEMKSKINSIIEQSLAQPFPDGKSLTDFVFKEKI